MGFLGVSVPFQLRSTAEQHCIVPGLALTWLFSASYLESWRQWFTAWTICWNHLMSLEKKSWCPGGPPQTHRKLLEVGARQQEFLKLLAWFQYAAKDENLAGKRGKQPGSSFWGPEACPPCFAIATGPYPPTGKFTAKACVGGPS